MKRKRESLAQAILGEKDSMSHEISAFVMASKGKLDAAQKKHDSENGRITARGKEILTTFTNVYEEYKRRMIHVHRTVKSLASAKAARREVSEVKRNELFDQAKSGPASLKAACMAEVMFVRHLHKTCHIYDLQAEKLERQTAGDKTGKGTDIKELNNLLGQLFQSD